MNRIGVFGVSPMVLENPKGDLAAWEVFLKLVNSMKNPQDKANADEHKPVNLLIPKPSIGEKNMRFFCAIFIKAR